MIKLEPGQVRSVLDKFEPLLKRRNTRRSYLEIAGFPARENVVSNFLAYYFDMEEDHQLGNLFVSALLEAVGIAGGEVRATTVGREISVNLKRIDLQIETDEYVIVIENKIFHKLENPLSAYHDHVHQLAKKTGKKPVKIILAPSPVAPTGDVGLLGFVPITYAGLFNQIRKRILNSESGSLYFLHDFMNGIEKLYNASMEDQQLHALFAEHEDQIELLFFEYQRRQQQFATEVAYVKSNFELPEEIPHIVQYIYRYTTLAHDITLPGSGIVVSVEVVRKYSGWHFHVFARGGNNAVVWKPEHLENLVVLKGAGNWAAELRVGQKVRPKILPPETDLQEVVDTMRQMLGEMRVL